LSGLWALYLPSQTCAAQEAQESPCQIPSNSLALIVSEISALKRTDGPG